MRSTARTTARAAAAMGLAAALAVTVSAPAQAKDKLSVDLRGYSAPSAPVGGTYSFAGLTTGDPFHGTAFAGTFGASDGTLPQSRACEPASGAMTMSGPSGSVTLALTGEMCEHWGTYPTNGTWTVTAADGELAKAKGTGVFAFNAQLWGTLWSASGTFKS